MKTINLENAQRLHEVATEKGFELPQALKSWAKIEMKKRPGKYNWHLRGTVPDDGLTALPKHEYLKSYEQMPSFDTNELLEALPDWTSVKKIEKCFVCKNEFKAPGWVAHGDTPQEALCFLYILLIKNDLI